MSELVAPSFSPLWNTFDLWARIMASCEVYGTPCGVWNALCDL